MIRPILIVVFAVAAGWPTASAHAIGQTEAIFSPNHVLFITPDILPPPRGTVPPKPPRPPGDAPCLNPNAPPTKTPPPAAVTVPPPKKAA